MNNLKNLRIEKKLYQKDIAKYLNMSQNGYSQYEVGITNIPNNILKNLAIYYDTSIDYILGLTDNKNSYPRSNIIPINSNMNRLKEIRENNDLLQEDIAKIINMSRNGYSHYETCYHEIPNKILIILAKYYNISTDYILYLTDDRTPYKIK